MPVGPSMRERHSWQGNCSLESANMRQIYLSGFSAFQKGPFRWIFAILLAAAFGIVTGHTVIASVSGSVCVVDGASMQPTFGPGSRIYTAPISTPLQRGDVVLVNDGNKEYALKRIVAMPGETIQFWRGYVFINRKMVREPYLPKHTYTFPDNLTEVSSYKLTDDQYFVMGDNRDYSVDSRRYGPVDREQIKSRVPSVGDSMRACFSAYTLPTQGLRTIKAL
jgi:signal peptidase I